MKTQMINILLFLVTLIPTIFIESKLIPILSRKAKQPIYEEGPAWHMKKQGTPTMGGIAFLLSISLSLVLYSFYLINLGKQRESGISLLISVLYAFGNAIIGIADDLTKLRRRQNGGLTPKQKLLLQSLLAILFLMSRRFYFDDSTTISLFFGNIDLGFIYYPLVFVILLGIVNCANLTDGIDGLAGSVAMTIGITLMLSALPLEIGSLASAITGACLGFLLFNSHPAKIFMGDTGSLFLGALIATVGFSFGNPLVTTLFGGVYVIEGVSVILQVMFFKLAGKRIFKMAPLHHHLEKCGFEETKICAMAVIFTLLMSMIGLMLVRI